ncbi:hypothetical protein Plec18167_000101 [Paecilomyces lecythidis]|uniref:Enoyl reductase (ER) domain-containing protein n=1 Tax=Paecilomyces lecythidis TaxID=3004212 RepID=A0ABR3YD30_9EURO
MTTLSPHGKMEPDSKPDSANMDEETYIPEIMQALYLPTGPYDKAAPPPPDRLIYKTDFPVPQPGPAQYLIKVQTAALSPDELSWGSTLDAAGQRDAIVARDFCGTVITTPIEDQTKKDGPKFKIGDQVMGVVTDVTGRDGAAADFVLATEDELAFKPRNVTAAEAATIPLPALTAWQALFRHGGLDPETTSRHQSGSQLRVLITAAWDHFVGMQALQLLRSRSLFPNGVWICATCASARNAEALRSNLGADAAVDRPEIAESFRTHGWDAVDIVLDCVGGWETLKRLHPTAVVRDKGVVVSFSNPAPEAVMKEVMGKCGPRTKFLSVEPDGKALERINELVEKEELRGGVDKVIDLFDGRTAMARVSEKAGIGRIVLRANAG